MAYGHAERNLALVRQLEAQTRQLLESLDRLDPEQSAWLQEVTRSNPPGARDAPGHRGLGLWAAPVSSVSMSPAHSFGPALVSGHWTSYWVYVAGPIAGALLAVGFAMVPRAADRP
jgi:hypothetical protein